jgi:hypothetical protein
MKKEGPQGSTGAAGSGGDAAALQRLFESAQGDGLGAGQLDELWSRVAPVATLGSADPTSGAGGAGPTSAATAATGGLGVKTIAVLLVVGGLVAGGVVHSWRSSQPAVHPIVLAPATAQAVEPTAPPALDPLAPPASPAQSVEVSALPAAPLPVRSSGRGHTAAAAWGDGRKADPPLARSFPDHGSTPASQGPAVVAGSSGPSGAVAPATASVTSTLAQGPTEGSLLLRARQRLASDPAGALALTEEHARRFPNGSLAPEREVLAIESLAALGRTADARARLAAFRAVYPQSVHLARLDALVGQ